MTLLASRFRHLAEVKRSRIANPPQFMRLGRLERPLPWEQALLEEIRETLPVERMQQYPDYPPFYAQLAKFVGVRQDRLVVGWGIEGLVRDLYMLCCEPGERVVIPWPTCAMFEVYARSFELWPAKIYTLPGHTHDWEEVVAAAAYTNFDKACPLLLLPNPGQPVETLLQPWDIGKIAANLPNTVVAVDEAYYGFGAPTAIELVDEHPNLVVLRTFSKAFGAAGIRLGYAVAGPTLHAALDAVRPSGEAASFSMHAASVLMRRYDEVVVSGIVDIVEGRDWLRDTVRRELGLDAWGSHANHVLIEFQAPEQAKLVAARLVKQRVYVKHGYEPPLDRHLLVTCGPRPLMEQFFSFLQGAYFS